MNTLLYTLASVFVIFQLINSNSAIKCNTTNDGVKECDFCTENHVVDLDTNKTSASVGCAMKTCDVTVVVIKGARKVGVKTCCIDKKCYVIAIKLNDGKKTDKDFCQIVTTKDGKMTKKCFDGKCASSVTVDVNGKQVAKTECCSTKYCYEPDLLPGNWTFTEKDIFSEFGCPARWARYGRYCFRSFPDQVTYFEARQRCKLQNNADLASITSSGMQRFLINRGLTRYSQFIGLNDIMNEGHFTWVDNSRYYYTNWANGEPNNFKNRNEDCVEMRSSGKWNDERCDARRGFLCKFKHY